MNTHFRDLIFLFWKLETRAFGLICNSNWRNNRWVKLMSLWVAWWGGTKKRSLVSESAVARTLPHGSQHLSSNWRWKAQRKWNDPDNDGSSRLSRNFVEEFRAALDIGILQHTVVVVVVVYTVASIVGWKNSRNTLDKAGRSWRHFMT